MVITISTPRERFVATLLVRWHPEADLGTNRKTDTLGREVSQRSARVRAQTAARRCSTHPGTTSRRRDLWLAVRRDLLRIHLEVRDPNPEVSDADQVTLTRSAGFELLRELMP
jgi:hypothetical protein